MIDLACSGDPAVLALLKRHPRVSRVEETPGENLQFVQGSWERRVIAGNPNLPIAGLVDQMDNNPLVCADQVSVPDAASTLALIALAPLINAGILLETPTVLLNFEADAARLDAFLARHHWSEGATMACQPMELDSVFAATVIAVIRTPDRLEDIDDLYEEAYGRSFYVRRSEAGDWDVKNVAGQPFALFRLRIGVDEGQSLLTILVMADRDGKCGAAQKVHCMNLMAGFEESLGI